MDIIRESEIAFQVITEIRNTRNAKGISPKEALTLAVKNKEAAPIRLFWPIVKKLSNITEISSVSGQVANGTSFLIGNMEFFIPLSGMVDSAKEREAILKDIEYQKGFLASVEKKLSNEKFVSSVPSSVLENERKKKADTEAKIKSLEESLRSIDGL
jgi:valyl-tRNA synthetase